MNLKFVSGGVCKALLLALWCAWTPGVSFADESEYNFSWLDPEKKVYVLQNRRYPKSQHASLSLLGGYGLGEIYRTVYSIQPRIGYWFNEEWGIEGFFSYRHHVQNGTYRALVNAPAVINATNQATATPMIREVNAQFGVLMNWAPWYAKINVFDTILYFDWYFSAGAGMLMTEVGPKSKTEAPSFWRSENLFAVFLGTGQLFHLSDMVDLRLDLLGHFYQADIYGGLNGSNQPTLFSSFTFNAGIGFRL